MMIIKMNQKKIITSKKAHLMAVVVIAASIVVATMISGINNSQNIQKAMAEEFYPSGTTTITEITSEYKTESADSNRGRKQQ